VLVHFSTALIPVSLASDIIGKYSRHRSLTAAGWWTLCYGAIATPLTAIAGWLWASDIGNMAGSTLPLHRWLGVALVAVFSGMALWRGGTFLTDQKPGTPYLVCAVLVVIAVLYQGYLGGKMTFG
jgi:uncharacterized membrane protein